MVRVSAVCDHCTFSLLPSKTQHNLKNAREYFEEHLCVGDYYDEGQSVAGEWIVLGAERLGLAGENPRRRLSAAV